LTRVPREVNGEGIVFSKNDPRIIGYPHLKKIKVDHYLSPHVKINIKFFFLPVLGF
jgi:hypothetical protein